MTLRLTLLILTVVPLTTFAADPGYLRYLPSDTRLVLSIHPQVIRTEERKRTEAFARQLYTTQLVPGLAKTDILPISDVRQVVIAQPFVGSLHSVVVVQGKLDRKLFETQIRKSLAGSRDGEILRLGRPAITVFRRAINEKALFALIPQLEKIPSAVRRLIVPKNIHLAMFDDETLFISLAGKIQVERALRSRSTRTEPRTTPALTDILRKQDLKSVTSFTLLDNSLHPAVSLVSPTQTREVFEQFEHIRSRIDGGKTVRVQITIKCRNKECALILERETKLTLDDLQKFLPKVIPDKTQQEVLLTHLKSYRIRVEDNRVYAEGTLPQEDARKLFK